MSHRIVSLIPSSTEIVAALGFADQLVGRSHECDFPPHVRQLPVCTAPKFHPEGSSAELDQQVKQLLHEAVSVYHVDAALLEQLQPTLIVTQSQCEVCAVSLEDVQAAVCAMLSSQPEIVALEANALADVWRDIGRVATALHVPDRGAELVAELQARMDAIAATARELPTRPSVACIEWIDPLMAAGNWMPELVALAGGTNLFGTAGHHSPWMTWEALVESNPDILVVLPCGFDIARTRQELHLLTERPEWQALQAVQTGRVYVTDGNQFFNRPGPRLAESLEILAEVIHPETFNFGHRAIGWIPLAEATLPVA